MWVLQQAARHVRNLCYEGAVPQGMDCQNHIRAAALSPSVRGCEVSLQCLSVFACRLECTALRAQAAMRTPHGVFWVVVFGFMVRLCLH